MAKQVETKQCRDNSEADYPLPIYEMTMRLDAARKTLEEIAEEIRGMDSEYVYGWGWLQPYERDEATTAALDVLESMAMRCQDTAHRLESAVDAQRGEFARHLKKRADEAKAAKKVRVGS